MLLDLNKPESIRAWVAIHPKRHKPQVRQWWHQWPQFREAIEQAMGGPPAGAN